MWLTLYSFVGPYPSYLVLTAWAVASTILVNSQCTRIDGTPITVAPFSYLIPLNSTGFLAAAGQSFASYIGSPTCSVGRETISSISINPSITVIQTSTATSQAPASLAVSPSLNGARTNSPPQPDILSTGAKIGIGIAIPICLVVLLVSGLVFLRRYRQKRLSSKANPELAAESRQLKGPSELQEIPPPQELEAHTSRQELEGQHRQELSGGEHSRELDARPT